MTAVYLFGTNNIARVLIAYLQIDKRYLLLGVTAHREFCAEPIFSGVPLIPFEDLPPRADSICIINCVSYINQMKKRKFIASQILEKRLPLLSYIHPSATVDGAEIGQGSLIMNNAVVEPYSSMGNGNILYGRSYICHDACIGEYNWFSTGCVLGGGVHMGDRNFVGINASIRDGITIGSLSVVAMGAVVVRDIKDNTVFMGNPASEKNASASAIRSTR